MTAAAKKTDKPVISDSYADAFEEILCIGMGRAAKVLNELTTSHVELTVPRYQLVPIEDLDKDEFKTIQVAIDFTFNGGFCGKAGFILNHSDAQKLANSLLEKNQQEALAEEHVAALTEVGNIALNAVLGSFGNITKSELTFTVPEYRERSIFEMMSNNNFANGSAYIFIADLEFKIQSIETGGTVILGFDEKSFVFFTQFVDSF